MSYEEVINLLFSKKGVIYRSNIYYLIECLSVGIEITTKNLVGRCRLYCGSYIIYRAYKDSRERREKIAKDNDCDREDVRCEGDQKVLDEGWNEDNDWGRIAMLSNV